jgi:hypothetical protein
VVSFKPLVLYSREKGPSVSIGEKAEWAPEPVWTLLRREKICPCRKSNPSGEARSPLLYRLSNYIKDEKVCEELHLCPYIGYV